MKLRSVSIIGGYFQSSAPYPRLEPTTTLSSLVEDPTKRVDLELVHIKTAGYVEVSRGGVKMGLVPANLCILYPEYERA